MFEEITAALQRILAERFDIARRLGELTSPAFEQARADMTAQLERLVPADILSVTPREYLGEIPRYLQAMRYRLDHLQGRVSRDAEHIDTVRAFEARVDRLRRADGCPPEEAHRLRFAVEELRVALFAEPVGTRGKVSAKRLGRDVLELERALGLA